MVRLTKLRLSRLGIKIAGRHSIGRLISIGSRRLSELHGLLAGSKSRGLSRVSWCILLTRCLIHSCGGRYPICIARVHLSWDHLFNMCCRSNLAHGSTSSHASLEGLEHCFYVEGASFLVLFGYLQGFIEFSSIDDLINGEEGFSKEVILSEGVLVHH